MPRTHHNHHSHNPGSLGLGRIVVPLLLNALTAPTERVKLLLQSQDEIILNLREESLALYHHQQQHHHHQHHSTDSTSSHAQSSSKTRSLKREGVSEKGLETIDSDKDSNSNSAKEEGEEEDDEDEEPRSILVPYAQLPFTDMQDCFQRLVEKEGPLSLWRGYSLEFLGSLALTKIEYALQRSRFLDFRSSHGGLNHGSTWVLFSTALHGTAVSSLALLAVYPFAVLQAKMATDLVRRVKRVKKTVVSTTQSTTLAASTPSLIASSTSTLPQETDEDEDQHGSGVLIERESTSSPFQEIEAVPYATSITSSEPQEEHQEEEEEEQSLTAAPQAPVAAPSTSSVLVEYEYELAYKFHKLRDALDDILASEGYKGLYKGFTPMLLGTLISRLGFMTLSRILTPLLTRPGSSLSRGGFVGGLCGFMLVFMSSSLIQFVVYPLGTIGHRQMIAHKGRYVDSCDAATKIVMKKEDGQSGEGWRSLYKGFEVALVRSAVLAVLSRMF